MSILIRSYICLFISTLLSFSALAQNEGIIYGEIVLKDKSSFVGPIRWSGGQLLWSDILLVSKTNSYILKYLNKTQLNRLNDKSGNQSLDWQFMNLWKDKMPERKDELLCRFGDIASIHITGTAQAQIYLKSGSKIRVETNENESRHLGKDITIYDEKLRKIKWEQISRINFRGTPEDFKPFKGLLYGTVSTSAGVLTGFIQWDKMKFLSNQKLKGKIGNSTETSEYKFATIHAIEKRDKGALIKFHSDEKVFLKNSRDVNSSNRGMVVMNPVWGRAIVEWEAFHSVRLLDVPKDLGYEAYPKPKKIYSTVSTTDGKMYKGNCTFDLDEEWNMELLEGSSNNVHFQIPFSQVSKLAPVGDNESRVVLKNDKVLNLGNHNDVTNKNWGLIVWLINSKYQYIPWNKVNEISFR
ncbi:MAG: hypothetical protein ACO1N7_00440 [Sphingobacteriaceae bacterium]